MSTPGEVGGILNFLSNPLFLPPQTGQNLASVRSGMVNMIETTLPLCHPVNYFLPHFLALSRSKTHPTLSPRSFHCQAPFLLQFFPQPPYMCHQLTLHLVCPDLGAQVQGFGSLGRRALGIIYFSSNSLPSIYQLLSFALVAEGNYVPGEKGRWVVLWK